MIILYYVFFGILGGLLYRIRGMSGNPRRPFMQAVFCLGYLIPLSAIHAPIGLSLAAYAVSVLFTCMGHGQWQSMSIKAMAPERLDFIVRWFFGQDPRTIDGFKYMRRLADSDYSVFQKASIMTVINQYGFKKLFWRNVTGMAISGLFMGLGPALALAYMGHNKMAIPLLIWSALGKGFAYFYGTKEKNTEFAEFCTGWSIWIACVALIIPFF